jgi:hypothetical protein
MNPINRQNKLLIFAALILGLYAGDRLVLTPELAAWDERAARIAQLDRDLSKGQMLLERREQMEERWADIQRRALPAVQSRAENLVFDSVDAWAGEAGVDVVSIKPRPVKIELKDVQSSFGKEEAYPAIEFRASARGSLQNIAHFLWLMETDPLALRIDEVEITPRDESMANISVNIRFDGLMMEPGADSPGEGLS